MRRYPCAVPSFLSLDLQSDDLEGLDVHGNAVFIDRVRLDICLLVHLTDGGARSNVVEPVEQGGLPLITQTGLIVTGAGEDLVLDADGLRILPRRLQSLFFA